MSGRQIRLNSRIFARFTKSIINDHLGESGDLMALLEKGMQDYNREQNEKNQKIAIALETMEISRMKKTIDTGL